MSVHNESNLDGYLRRRHSVSKLVVHLVFTTKYRRRVFTGEMIEHLKSAFGSACEKLECQLLEMDGEEDHVHLLIAYPPKQSVSIMVNNLKAVSSRMLRQTFPQLKPQSKTSVLWSRSYFACSAGGATIETLKAYVQGQATPE